MKASLFLVLLIAQTGFAASGAADELIPLIGLDKDGNQVAVEKSANEYTEQMTTVYSTLQESLMSAIGSRPSNQKWMLRQVIVGAGVQFDAGLGPIISVSVKPRMRLLFANSSSPFFP